jgi:hypothetical protein
VGGCCLGKEDDRIESRIYISENSPLKEKSVNSHLNIQLGW